jgi:sugar lactone lactonase YvrE
LLLEVLPVALLLGCGSLTAAAGHLYVTDRGTSYVRKYLPTGSDKTFASIGDCSGLAFDSTGVLYVASYNGSIVYKVGARGSTTVFASGPLIENPLFLIFDNSGNLFVSHQGYHPGIAKIAPNGSITTFATQIRASDLAFDSAGYLYAASEAEFGFDSVVKFTPDGGRSTFVSGFSAATGLAFDAAGNLFVADSVGGGPGMIWKVTPIGYMTAFVTDLVDPQGLAFDKSGNLYVGELVGYILKVPPDGGRSTFALVSQPWDLAFPP